MNRLEKYQTITQKLLEVFERFEGKDEQRAAMMEEINSLIEQREEIIKTIIPPYTAEEMKIGKNLLILEKEVEQKMALHFEQIQSDLKKIKHKKSTETSYINPYKNMKTVDGMYVDNKL